ncbi:MAG: GDP-mannose 4,6-dehydratase [Actinobacteria bacterium]|nr:GDP-mannose 4,6-dehydratase [Actinomycetota bacterium]
MNKNYWKNKNVFITGATGFLGSWLTEYLFKSGANVAALIRDWIPESDLINKGFTNKINVIRGNVEDYFLIERILNEYEIHTVFHLAAQTIVSIANNNPISTFETNIKGTWNILEACRRNKKIKKIIIASSDKAYGDQIQLPYDESFPLIGRHPYDVSKSCADLICKAYFETYALPVCITRCGNFYGGGDLNFNRIIPGTIRSILNNEPPVIRSDGSFIRDYFYIEDGMLAYILLAEKMDNPKLYGEAFNFSNEIQITVLELVDKILELMGSKLKPVILNEAGNEIKHQYLSAKKAREVLGWKPKFDLESGLKKTIDYYKNFFAIKGA